LRRISDSLERDAISGFRDRAMVIAMAVVRIVEMPFDQVIDMVAMRHGLMAAIRPMLMFNRMPHAFVLRRAVLGVGRGYADYMFIDVAVMRVMQMPIVQVINMTIVHDPRMAAPRPMRVVMIFVLRGVTIPH
jgi:hypothetical protein